VNKRTALLLAGIIGAGFILSACGGSPAGPVTVNVTASEYKFESSMTNFKVGVPYHFVVTNQGTMEHEFMIIKPEPSSVGSEQLDSDALAHIEEADLQPGETQSVDYTFLQAYPEGSLEFACHLPDHYEKGMHTSIVVK
jgi:uncharacterized cupredoxin-like copper-binding protein